jgi:nucleoside-diphosphate-sugar epimerase
VKTALVTGSEGFAGRHYVQALEERGYEVYGIDPAHGSNRADALDYFASSNVGWDLVIHCAAVVGGRAVIDGDPLTQVVNIQLDAAMFRWAMRVKPGRTVYISSSAAYPSYLQELSLRHNLEEFRIDPSFTFPSVGTPDQLYGWAKLIGENLAWRARQAGLKVTVIRPFSGYGEDQDPAYPFRAFAERAKRREDPFRIWGSAVQCRDFIHIDDIVAATLLMCDEGLDGPVNLGTGRATTMAQLARVFTTQAGYSPLLETVKDAPMGVGYRVADVTALSEFYTPKVTLEEGVRRALA